MNVYILKLLKSTLGILFVKKKTIKKSIIATQPFVIKANGQLLFSNMLMILMQILIKSHCTNIVANIAPNKVCQKFYVFVTCDAFSDRCIMWLFYQ